MRSASFANACRLRRDAGCDAYATVLRMELRVNACQILSWPGAADGTARCLDSSDQSVLRWRRRITSGWLPLLEL